MASSCSSPQETWTSNEIKVNLVYLTENITNLSKILIHLIQQDIITEDERQLIDFEKTDSRKNHQLLYLIQKKNWAEYKANFLEILNITGNRHCAEKIDQTPITLRTTKRSKILPSKWWPEKKTLPAAFQVRKANNQLLTAQIKEMFLQHTSTKMTVITQKVTVSGLGGIGKTTTAIWFATQYKKDYSHIIWIDCGEKSLPISFKNLAIDLDVKHRSELELKKLALDSFQILKDFKCLFIFDNAECYTGPEGVKEVLPKFNENFDVLITSRNTNWGDGTGDGEVPQFSMNLFDQQEGVEFVKNNTKGLSNSEESSIKFLCSLLGNHPLALQIAVATVNKENIHLEEYIIRIKNTPEILHAKFDNYETTIYKTLKISIDFINVHASDDERRIGEVAHTILNIFGYITPDDVPREFFMALEMSIHTFEMDAAVKLLESYSLLSKKGKFGNTHNDRVPCSNFSNEINFGPTPLHHTSRLEISTTSTGNVNDYQHTLSIHRLLQQVVSHNTKESQEKILEKILTCEGFLDYKLIPFIFANKKLQKQFPKIKAELIDKLKLVELLRERRFAEAVELSRIISNTLKNPLSAFNFAVCLKHNSELTESENVFNNVLRMISNTANQSLLSHLGSFKRLFRSNAANKLKYTVNNEYDCFTRWGTTDSSSSIINKDVIMGELFSIYLLQKNVDKARNVVLDCKQIILPIIPLNEIISLFDLCKLPNVFLELHQYIGAITLKAEAYNYTHTMELLPRVIDETTRLPNELQDLNLTNLVVLNNGLLITKNLKLCNVTVFQDRQYPTSTIINVFVGVDKFERLTLTNILISLSTRIEGDQLTLKNVVVDDWSKAKWVVNTLFLHNMRFTQKMEMTITYLQITHSSVDITILPSSLRQLKLNECFLISCVKSVNAIIMPPYLEELSLINVYVEGRHGQQCIKFDISHFISPTLSKLIVKDFGCNCYCLQLSMNCLTSITYLHLENCGLELLPNILLAPTELKLNNVRILRSHDDAATAVVNHFVDMKNIQLLCLTGMTIDFSVPVDIRELTLINSKLINWKTGCWSVRQLNTYPNPGQTQMEIEEWQNLQDPENVENTSNIEIKKEKLLNFLKSISGSKTIAGLYLYENNKSTIEKTQGVFPGILAKQMPQFSAGVDKWNSFVENTISYWNNNYLIQIRYLNGHPLYDIIEDGHETSWNDLIQEKGKRNQLWKKSLDTLAPFLLQLQTAGVVPILDLLPVINHRSYLWGGRGGLEGSLKLFQITKDYLTQHHGLTSLIWNWSLIEYGDMTRLEDYWPGNNYVDVASVYMWKRKQLSSIEYQKLLDVVGDKPIAMEWMFYVPSTELLATQTRWTWFTVDHEYLTNERYNSEENTKRTFQSPSVINRETNQFFNSTLPYISH